MFGQPKIDGDAEIRLLLNHTPGFPNFSIALSILFEKCLSSVRKMRTSLISCRTRTMLSRKWLSCSVEEVRLKKRRDANKAYAERIASIVLRKKVGRWRGNITD